MASDLESRPIVKDDLGGNYIPEYSYTSIKAILERAVGAFEKT